MSLVDRKSNLVTFKYPINYLVYTPETLAKSEPSSTTGGIIQNFEQNLIDPTNTKASTLLRKQLIGEPTDYSQFNRAKTYGEGDPGKGGRDRSVYYNTNLRNTSLKKSELEEIYEYDKINTYPLYSSTEPHQSDPDHPNDLIKFNIGVVNLDNPDETTWIHLKAYIKSFSDSYNASWQGFKYMGRGNEFYQYNGYRRGIRMGFEAVVHSKYEQAFVYDKLNFLASTLAPNYSAGGYMRGNIIKLTVGDYLNGVHGIIQSLNYSIPDDTPWDIARKSDGSKDKDALELPMRIVIDNFEFIPIHDFVDRSIPNSYASSDLPPDQRYISLDNGFGYKATKSIPPRLNSIQPSPIPNTSARTPTLQV